MNTENLNDYQLDKLFQSARNQAPTCSYTETQTAFVVAAGLGIGSSSTGLKILGNTLFKTKFFIMTATAITILTSSILFLNSNTTLDGKKDKHEIEIFTSKPFQGKVNESEETAAIFNEIEVHKNSTQALVIGLLHSKPYQSLVKGSDFVFLPSFSALSTSKMASDTIKVVHSIHDKTTISDFETIKNQAEKAGIRFHYDAKYRKNKLHKIEYSLRIKENKQSYRVVKLKGSSSKCPLKHDIVWRTNEVGQVIDFGPKRTCGQAIRTVASNEITPVKLEITPIQTERRISEPTANLLENEVAQSEDRKADPNIMLNRKSASNLRNVSHLIKNSTLEFELTEIQERALEAGIKFEYEVYYKKDEIQRLNIVMIIRTETGNLESSINKVKNRGEMFSLPIIWRVDENNRAVDFGTPNQRRILGGI